ncbi:MAG: hypothetical protein ACI3VR_00590 [Intestinibacter sp.]|uniref:hypothetical protein n=1 Tax=Intestinibacter sp. TaxID=1965304 RepID=UPI003F13E12B
MKKSELENLALLELRNGKRVRFVGNTFIAENLEALGEDFFDEDLLQAYGDKEEDVMKVFDDVCCDENHVTLIWERKEIDWSKVPVGTPVLVRNYDMEDWIKAYFIEIGSKSFYVLNKRKTMIKDYRECKLMEEPLTIEGLKEEYKTHGECYGPDACYCCDYKKYKDINPCMVPWILNKFNLIRK